MAKKRAVSKPSGHNDNINDFLDRRERRYRYDQTRGYEVLMPGDVSKVYRAKLNLDRFLSGRTVEAGTRSLLQGMKSYMVDRFGGGGSRLTGR
jgi:hypothetical protein